MSILPNTLVIVRETSKRWFLGTFVKEEGGEATVKWIDRREDIYPTAQVKPFLKLLEKRRHGFRRSELCIAIYNRKLLRLSDERLQGMQRFLRKHGIRFSADWSAPDSRIRLHRDASVILGGGKQPEAKLSALLPQWLVPVSLPPGSRDPLGFQAKAENLAGLLLPGLTVFTNRVGYYGFLAWAIERVNREKVRSGFSRRELFNRLERVFALSEFVHHGAGDDTCPIIGSRSRTRVLESAEGALFPVPERILRNQNSSGAYRLYITSLVNFELAVERDDLAAEDFLPYQLTDSGKELAKYFAKHLDEEAFVRFAWNGRRERRDNLRQWGKNLCISEICRDSYYRKTFLRAFILGNNGDAERRYETIWCLFGSRLLSGDYGVNRVKFQSAELLSEEEAAADDETGAVQGLSNLDVLLRFYGQAPKGENRNFQMAAVYELLALGWSALFYSLSSELDTRGRFDPIELGQRIAADKEWGPVWRKPVSQGLSVTGSVRNLVGAILFDGPVITRAAAGGALLLRVMGGRPFDAVRDDLSDAPTLILASQAIFEHREQSLQSLFHSMVLAMLERHTLVSQNKNRQRWCFLEDGQVCRDDLQPFVIGLHSYRFPQMYSLCRDLSLKREDLQHG